MLLHHLLSPLYNCSINVGESVSPSKWVVPDQRQAENRLPVVLHHKWPSNPAVSLRLRAGLRSQKAGQTLKERCGIVFKHHTAFVSIDDDDGTFHYCHGRTSLSCCSYLGSSEVMCMASGSRWPLYLVAEQMMKCQIHCNLTGWWRRTTVRR